MASLTKSYSRLKLLSKKMGNSQERKTFWEYLFVKKHHNLLIEVPLYDFMRGKVFVSDMKELLDDAPDYFSIYDLIALLYYDFMQKMKRGFDPAKLAYFFMNAKKAYLSPPQPKKKVLKQVKENLFTFEEPTEVQIVKSDEKESKLLVITMKESEILRGEVYLHDLAPFLGDEHIILEELLAILFIDFIHRIKDTKNSLEVMEALLDSLVEM